MRARGVVQWRRDTLPRHRDATSFRSSPIHHACAQVATYGFWHATVYAGNASRALAAYKFSPENQYEPEGPVGHISSSTGTLQVSGSGGSVSGGGGGANGTSLA